MVLGRKGLVRNRGMSNCLGILHWISPSSENSSIFSTAVLLQEGVGEVWSAAGARVVCVCLCVTENRGIELNWSSAKFSKTKQVQGLVTRMNSQARISKL